MPLICPKDIPSARFVGTSGFPDEGHGDMDPNDGLWHRTCERHEFGMFLWVLLHQL